MRILLLLGLLPLLAACRAEEEQAQKNAESYAQQAMQLYSNGCVANGADEAKITAWAQNAKMQALGADEIEKWGFEPTVRKAWAGHSPNGGRFLLAAGGQYCSVKARVADEAIVRREFMRLAEAGGGGLQAEPRGDLHTDAPFSLSQLAYAWNSEGSANEWMLTATTSSAAEAPMQAALNVYVVPREITRAISN